MKIVLHSLAEVLELAALIKGGSYTAAVGDISCTVRADDAASENLPPARSVERRLAVQTGAPIGADPGVELGATSHGEAPAVDSSGRAWDERIDSGNHGLNADGTWRARRGVSPELREKVLNELAAAEAQTTGSDEPVATETHALPKDDPKADEPVADASTEHPKSDGADLTSLLEASQEAAQDASDSHADLIKACQGFISERSHAAFNELKGAVAPAEGTPNGKSLPMFSPGERRLMQACIANYSLFV